MGRKSARVLDLAEKEKAKVLHSLGHTCNAIGQELGRDPKTIKKYLTSTAEVVDEVVKLKQDAVKLYEGLAQRILESIDDADIKKANLRDRVISAGVCTDKHRLLSGESTVNAACHITNIIEEANRYREATDTQMIESGGKY